MTGATPTTSGCEISPWIIRVACVSRARSARDRGTAEMHQRIVLVVGGSEVDTMGISEM